MAQGVWIDSRTHLKAYGDIQPDGSMKGCTIDDNNGTTVDRDRDFKSRAAFDEWAKNWRPRA